MSQQPPRVTTIKYARLQRAARRNAAKRAAAQPFQDGETRRVPKRFLETDEQAIARAKREDEGNAREQLERDLAGKKRLTPASELTPEQIARELNLLVDINRFRKTTPDVLLGRENLETENERARRIELQQNLQSRTRSVMPSSAAMNALGYPRTISEQSGSYDAMSAEERADLDLLSGRIAGTLDVDTPTTLAGWQSLNVSEFEKGDPKFARNGLLQKYEPALFRLELRKQIRASLPFFPSTEYDKTIEERGPAPIYGESATYEDYLKYTDRLANLLDKEIRGDKELDAKMFPNQEKAGLAGTALELINKAWEGLGEKDPLFGDGEQWAEDPQYNPARRAKAAAEFVKKLDSPLGRDIQNRAAAGIAGALLGTAGTFWISRNPAALSLAPQVGFLIGQAMAAKGVDPTRGAPYATALNTVKWYMAAGEWARLVAQWRTEQDDRGTARFTARQIETRMNQLLDRYDFTSIEDKAAFKDNLAQPIIERQRVLETTMPKTLKEHRLAALDALYDQGYDANRLLAANIRLMINGAGAERISTETARAMSDRMLAVIAGAKTRIQALKKEYGVSTPTMMRVENIVAQMRDEQDETAYSALNRELQAIGFNAAELRGGRGSLTVPQLLEMNAQYRGVKTDAERVFSGIVRDETRRFFTDDTGNVDEAAHERRVSVLAGQSVQLALLDAVKSDVGEAAVKARDLTIRDGERKAAIKQLQAVDQQMGERLWDIHLRSVAETPGAESALLKNEMLERPTLFAPTPSQGSEILQEIAGVAGVGAVALVNTLGFIGVLDNDQKNAAIQGVTGTVQEASKRTLGEAATAAMRWISMKVGVILTPENVKGALTSVSDAVRQEVKKATNAKIVTDLRTFIGDAATSVYEASADTLNAARGQLEQWGISLPESEHAIEEHRKDVDRRATEAINNPKVREELEKAAQAEEAGEAYDDAPLREKAAPGLLDALWSEVRAGITNGYKKTKNAAQAQMISVTARLKGKKPTSSDVANAAADLSRETGISHEAAHAMLAPKLALTPEQAAEQEAQETIERQQRVAAGEAKRAEIARRIAEFRAQADVESTRLAQMPPEAEPGGEAAPGGPEAPTGRPAAPQTPQQLLEAAQQALELQGPPPKGYQLPPAIAKALSPDLQKKALAGRLGERLGEARVALGKPGVEGRQEFALLDKWGRPTGRTLITFAGGRTVIFRPNPTVQRAKQVLSSGTATTEQKQAATAVIKEWAQRVSAPERERAKRELSLYQGTLYGPAARKVQRPGFEGGTFVQDRDAEGKLVSRRATEAETTTQEQRDATLGEVGVQAARDAQEDERVQFERAKRAQDAALEAEATAKRLGFTVREPPPEAPKADLKREIAERNRLVDRARDASRRDRAVTPGTARVAGQTVDGARRVLAAKDMERDASRFGAALARIGAQRAARPPVAPKPAPAAPETPKPAPAVPQTRPPALAEQMERERQASIKALSESDNPRDRELARKAAEETRTRRPMTPEESRRAAGGIQDAALAERTRRAAEEEEKRRRRAATPAATGPRPAAFSELTEAQRAKKRKHKKNLKRR